MILALGWIGTLAPHSDRRISSIISPEDRVAAAAEVRMRKLHLVRPDLINYPLSIEVYC